MTDVRSQLLTLALAWHLKREHVGDHGLQVRPMSGEWIWHLERARSSGG